MASVVVTSGPIMMTAEEAKQATDRVKEGLENVRALLLDIYEREGWRALGYESFVAYAETEFSASKSQAYRLLDAARLDAILSPIGETGLPEGHLRELRTVIGEPEVVRTVVKQVRQLKGDAMTAADVRGGLDQHLERPPLAARSTKPARPVSPTRHRDADSQEQPDDDAVLGFEPVADQIDPNNEAPIAGRPPVLTQRCGLCNEHFAGGICPCSDRPGAAEGAAATAPADAGLDPSASKSPAPPASSESDSHKSDAASSSPSDTQRARSESAGSGIGAVRHGTHPSTVRPVSSRPLDAGDLTRALFDFPHAAVVEAIGEALTAQERGSLAAQMIDALPTAEVERLAHRIAVRARNGASAAPDLRVALAERAPAEIVEALADGASVTRLTALVSLLAERLTRARLQSGAVRVAV